MEREVIRVAAMRWLDYGRDERGLSRASIETYRSQVKRCLSLLPDPFDPSDLKDAVMARVGESQSAHTRTQAHVVLNQFFEWWEVQGGFKNPLRAMRRPPRSKARRRGLTEQELEMLSLRLRSARLKDQAMIYLMLFEGFRIGDVCKLKVEDVDFRGHRIRCRFGKGGSDTWLPMGKSVETKLENYLETFKIDGGYVFTGPQGALTPMSIGRAWRRVAGAELRGLTAHSLRHSYATLILRGQAHTDIFTLRKLMRHSSLATTQLYLDDDLGAETTAIIDLDQHLRARLG